MSRLTRTVDVPWSPWQASATVAATLTARTGGTEARAVYRSPKPPQRHHEAIASHT